MQRIGGREPLRGELGDFYDAIEQPRKIRGELPILHGRRGRAPTWSRCASAPSRCSTRSTSTPANPLLARRLRLRDAPRPRAPAQRDDAAAPADGRGIRAGRGRSGARRRSRSSDGPEMVPVEGGELTRSAPPADGFAYDNERPRHRVELEAFRIDRTPVTNGAYIEFLEETGAEPPMYWERDGEGGWVRTAMGRTEAGRPATTRDPRLLGRGRRLRALGGQAAADRARVGGRRRRAPIRERANLDQLAFGCAPAGAYARRRLGLRRRADAGRRLGVDELGLHRLPGLRGLPLPRVLGGLLRRRAQGAARRGLGGAARRDPHQLPQLGPAERRQIFSGIRCARDA